MKHRPEHAIAVAQVITVVVFPAQIDGSQRHVAGLLGMHFPFARRAAFDHRAAPAEPQAAIGRQGVAQRHGQAARRRGLARVRDTVGNDDQSVLHTWESQGADKRTAALMMPTIE